MEYRFVGFIDMTYRKFDTATWQDPWFETLGPFEKLSFVYLWSNDYCTQSGIYQISPKRFQFDTGIEMNGPVERLHPKVEWIKETNTIWVKSFFKHQCQSSKFAKSALDSLKSNPQLLKQFIETNIAILESYDKLDLSEYDISK